jgi:Fe-S-cluster containining protein
VKFSGLKLTEKEQALIPVFETKRLIFLMPEGVTFECKKCAQCCIRPKGTVLRDYDIQKLNKSGFKDYFDSVREWEEDEITHITRKGIIKKTKTCECIFLKNNLCSVYRDRPIICSTFPFKISGRGKFGRHLNEGKWIVTPDIRTYCNGWLRKKVKKRDLMPFVHPLSLHTKILQKCIALKKENQTMKQIQSPQLNTSAKIE